MHPAWSFRNPQSARDLPYGPAQRAVIAHERLHDVEIALQGCPLHRPTPLRPLPRLAAELGLGEVLYKDEAGRLGFGAFKALGGVYAVGRQLIALLERRHGIVASFADLVAGTHRALLRDVRVTAASSGNHGRAVAAGARLFGAGCTILLPGFTSVEKTALVAARGAEVIRIDGDYDQALAECRRLAAARGWIVVSDTSWDGYVEIPRDVMQAYGVIAAEIMTQCAETGAAVPTHVVLQAGVGGLAAGIAGTLWEALGSARPTLIVVEPETADCFLQTARAGRPTPASGDASTAMGGLACREISPEAWTVLAPSVDWFLTVPESGVAGAVRRLARPATGDRPIAAGPSATAGLQALVRLAGHAGLRAEMALDARSRVLLIGSEGAAGDAGFFTAAAGVTVEAIEAAGVAWDRAA